MRIVRRAGALPLLGLLAACAIPPPPPSPDALPGGYAEAGSLGTTDPAHAAGCVSLEMPSSVAVPVSDGAAVRPAPGTVDAAAPDYAVTLRRADALVSWRVEVAGATPDLGAAVAERLTRALANCYTRLDGR